MDSISSSPPKSSRPTVKRTYGKLRPPSSPPPLTDSSSPWNPLVSSSSSFMLTTPPSSPVTKRKRVGDSDVEGFEAKPGSSPSFMKDTSIVLQENMKENILIKPSPKHSKKQTNLMGFFEISSKFKKPLQPARTVYTVSSDVDVPLPVQSTNNEATRNSKIAGPSRQLQQSHLTHLPLLHTCSGCGMTYTRGGEDEGLHARQHSRVLRGILWEGLGKSSAGTTNKGKKKDMKSLDIKGWTEIESVSFGPKRNCRGQIIVCDGSWGGSKLEEILQLVDLSLSSPPLPPAILDRCKIFLLVTESSAPLRPGIKAKLVDRDTSKKRGERIVSIVVAQSIKWAMRILRSGEECDGVKVHSGGGVICDPTPLDTSLGIHRLYTIPSYRSLGLAQVLLDASLSHTVYGCTFDTQKGEVAFSQPTESGRAVMEKWGNGNIRVFVDDESQI